MRVGILTNRARHIYFPIDGQNLPGILVEGPHELSKQKAVFSNYFMPFLGCELLDYHEGNSYNNDQFSVLNHVGVFKTEEGGLVFAPSSDYNDYAFVFVQLLDCKSFVVTIHSGPSMIKRIEFDDGIFSDVFMMVLKKNTTSVIYSFTSKGEVLEYSYLYDYEVGEVGFKVRKVD